MKLKPPLTIYWAGKIEIPTRLYQKQRKILTQWVLITLPTIITNEATLDIDMIPFIYVAVVVTELVLSIVTQNSLHCYGKGFRVVPFKISKMGFQSS